MVRWLPDGAEDPIQPAVAADAGALVGEVPHVLAPVLQLDERQLGPVADQRARPSRREWRCAVGLGRRGRLVDVGQPRRRRSTTTSTRREEAAGAAPAPTARSAAAAPTCTPGWHIDQHPILASAAASAANLPSPGRRPCPGAPSTSRSAAGHGSAPVGEDDALRWEARDRLRPGAAHPGCRTINAAVLFAGQRLQQARGSTAGLAVGGLAGSSADGRPLRSVRRQASSVHVGIGVGLEDLPGRQAIAQAAARLASPLGVGELERTSVLAADSSETPRWLPHWPGGRRAPTALLGVSTRARGAVAAVAASPVRVGASRSSLPSAVGSAGSSRRHTPSAVP